MKKDDFTQPFLVTTTYTNTVVVSGNSHFVVQPIRAKVPIENLKSAWATFVDGGLFFVFCTGCAYSCHAFVFFSHSSW